MRYIESILMPIMPTLTFHLTVLSDNPSLLKVYGICHAKSHWYLVETDRKGPGRVIGGQIGSDPRSITALPRDPDSDTVFELLLSIMDEGDFEGIWLKNRLLLTSDNVWKLLVMYLDYSNGLQSYKFHI